MGVDESGGEPSDRSGEAGLMVSTLVHLSVAGLLAAALLPREFDGRALAVVLLVTAVPDLDAFLALAFPGTHRAALHTLLLPVALAVPVLWDSRRPGSWLRRRYGDRGVRVAGVALLSLLVAGIVPDLTHTGVNLLYPLHDQFYTVDGKLLWSSERGLVQTLIEIGAENGGSGGTTANTSHPSPADPAEESPDPERKYWLAGSGLRLHLVLTSVGVVALRLRESAE